MGDFGAREYELVLLGATGYTGKLCAEHITHHLPTDLKWAIAGRSSSKLSSLLQSLISSNPDRQAPGKFWMRGGTPRLSSQVKTGIEVTTLSDDDLPTLTKRTKLVLNTVGPYHLYSTPVVSACAQNGTHYLDVTGESPWVLEMIEKFHETARKNNAIIIPEIGIESAPSDMLAWALATLFREKLSVATKEIITSLHEIKSAPSGGTLATLLTILESYGLKGMARATKPWAMSPIPGPSPTKSNPLTTRLFGVRRVSGLGVLTTSVMGSTNAAIVQRSWGLLDQGRYYGPKFQYREYMTVQNALVGVFVHFAFVISAMALLLRPCRWLVKKFIYAPGEGPTKENTKKEAFEWRAVATADTTSQTPERAFGRFRYDGPIYYFTGLCLAEAAMVILRGEPTRGPLSGGVLTPATLGQPFIDRMKQSGIILEVTLLDDN